MTIPWTEDDFPTPTLPPSIWIDRCWSQYYCVLLCRIHTILPLIFRCFGRRIDGQQPDDLYPGGLANSHLKDIDLKWLLPIPAADTVFWDLTTTMTTVDPIITAMVVWNSVPLMVCALPSLGHMLLLVLCWFVVLVTHSCYCYSIHYSDYSVGCVRACPLPPSVLVGTWWEISIPTDPLLRQVDYWYSGSSLLLITIILLWYCWLLMNGLLLQLWRKTVLIIHR